MTCSLTRREWVSDRYRFEEAPQCFRDGRITVPRQNKVEGESGWVQQKLSSILVIFYVHFHLWFRDTDRCHAYPPKDYGMTIEETLLQRYGPLLSISQLATVLDRSPDGLRISLRSSNEWSARLNTTRLKIGRRVYFRTSQVAQMFSEEGAPAA